MRKTSARMLATLTLAGLAAVVGAGCAEPTPEERVAEMRGRYSAELQNFVVNEVPLPGSEVTAHGVDGAEGVDPVAEEAEGEDGMNGMDGMDGMEEMDVPVQTDVVLDVLIRNGNHELLPGVTLDVAQVGEGGPEEASWDEIVASPRTKQTWRIWVDTSTIGRGPGTSVTYRLEDVEDYQPDDRFVVTVREPVPAAERGDYREYAEAS